MKKYLGFLVVSFLCWQCKQPATIVYEGAILTDNKVHLTPSVLNDSFLFSWPKDLIICDSLLVLHDSYQQDNCFHIFRKSDGSFIKSFGKKGRGPGELNEIRSVNVNDNGELCVYDLGYRKVVLFDIGEILTDEKSVPKEYEVTGAPNNIMQAIPFTDHFIVKGNDDLLRYAVWNPQEEKYSLIYTEYPRFSTDDEDNWSLSNYNARFRASPDRKMFAATTYIGGALEVYEVEEGNIRRKAARFFFEPHYDYARGAIPKWVTLSSESVVGFEDLYFAKDAIYGLIWGVNVEKEKNARPKLIDFDFEGNPLHAYIVAETLSCIAVDRDGTLFGVGCDSVGNYKLSRYVQTCG
ncbi:BF3164 family lipoprotein [Alistipes communis]|uniref:BF3164 family lipoprotein n=1 Tax=Alistipes communis TaxID=2585118 RepID=UPI003207D9EA